MAAASLHPRIKVLISSEVTDIKGHLGTYQVEVTQKPGFVTEACNLCGQCQEICPIRLTENRRAIYLPSPRAFPGRYVIDPEHCSRCGACVPVCPEHAIDLEAEPVVHAISAGSLVVATGFKPFEVAASRYEAWHKLPRVLTSLELETALAAAGLGLAAENVLGPDPTDIAFLLCVGSREETGNRYCSRICCATALKQALELKERFPGARVRVYYRDIRTVRREWEELYVRARQAGILFLRGRVRDIHPL